MADFRDRVDRSREYIERNDQVRGQEPLYFLLIMAFIVIILGGLSLALFGFGLLT